MKRMRTIATMTASSAIDAEEEGDVALLEDGLITKKEN